MKDNNDDNKGANEVSFLIKYNIFYDNVFFFCQHHLRRIINQLQNEDPSKLPDQLEIDPGPFPKNSYRLGFFLAVRYEFYFLLIPH